MHDGQIVEGDGLQASGAQCGRARARVLVGRQRGLQIARMARHDAQVDDGARLELGFARGGVQVARLEDQRARLGLASESVQDLGHRDARAAGLARALARIGQVARQGEGRQRRMQVVRVAQARAFTQQRRDQGIVVTRGRVAARHGTSGFVARQQLARLSHRRRHLFRRLVRRAHASRAGRRQQ